MPIPLQAEAQALSESQTTTPVPTLTFSQEKQKLELERLRLENEKIKLEVEKLKEGNTKAEKPSKAAYEDGEKRKAAESFAVTMTLKAEALAKKNKAKKDLIVVDFANAEVWNQGVRYNLYEAYSMAEDQHRPMEKKVDEISTGGAIRYRYTLQNLSLLKYEDRERGIWKLSAPVNQGDFQVMTPDGISFSSLIGDVRNALQNPYFRYDGERHESNLKILKYIHPMEWKFSDKLEFAFDRNEKLVYIRFGVLDEH